MSQRHPSMKLIASTVVFTFFITSLQISPNAFAATGVPTLNPEVSSLPAGMLSIPAELGQVTDTLKGDPKAPAFIHIQSAHGNYQAEKNIEKLLGYIEKNSSVKLMLLEGAAAKLQPELFRLFPENPAFNQKVTDKLMQEGYLTGPENFLINQKIGERETGNEQLPGNGKRETVNANVPRSTFPAKRAAGMAAFGVEDLDSYKKDREAFISVVKKEKTAEKFLGSLRATIDKRYASKLNKDLLNLVRQEEAFGSGTVSFEGWLKALGEGSKKHLKLDLSDAFYQDQYPSLIRYYRLVAIGSKIDRDKAAAEQASFLAELKKLGMSKEIIHAFEAASGNGERGTGNEQSLGNGERNSAERNVNRSSLTVNRDADGYSVVRRAFDMAFAKLPKNFSMKQWPNWTLYAQQTILMQELQGKGLQEETIKLKDNIETALAKTADEKAYLSAARKLYLLRRLFSLELTRKEYAELQSFRISPDELAAGLQTTDQRPQTKNKVLQSPVTSLQSVFANAVEFYETAIVRENAMFRNALSKMSEQKQQRAVIVTGGFHADGLKALAASKHCSYVQITPRINEVSKNDREVYLRSILGSRDIETSQMPALLGLVGRAERVAVTGAAATQDWARNVRALILDMIRSEKVNSQALSSVFAHSLLSHVLAASQLGSRSEIRNEAMVTGDMISSDAAEAAKKPGAVIPKSRFQKVDGVRSISSLAEPLGGGVLSLLDLGNGYVLAGTYQDQKTHVLKAVKDGSGAITGIEKISSLAEPLGGNVRSLLDLGNGYVLAGTFDDQKTHVLKAVKDGSGAITGIEKISSLAEPLGGNVRSLLDLGNGYVLAGTFDDQKTHVLKVVKDGSGSITRIEKISSLAEPLGGRVTSLLDLGNGYVLAGTLDSKTHVLKTVKDGSGAITGIERFSSREEPLGGYVWSLLDLGNGYVLAGTEDDSRIHILKAEKDGSGAITGIKKIYTFAGPLGGDVDSLLDLGNGYVLVGLNGKTYVVKTVKDGSGAITGGIEWIADLAERLGGEVGSLLDLGNGYVLAGTYQDQKTHVLKIDGELAPDAARSEVRMVLENYGWFLAIADAAQQAEVRRQVENIVSRFAVSSSEEYEAQQALGSLSQLFAGSGFGRISALEERKQILAKCYDASLRFDMHRYGSKYSYRVFDALDSLLSGKGYGQIKSSAERKQVLDKFFEIAVDIIDHGEYEDSQESVSGPVTFSLRGNLFQMLGAFLGGEAFGKISDPAERLRIMDRFGSVMQTTVGTQGEESSALYHVAGDLDLVDILSRYAKELDLSRNEDERNIAARKVFERIILLAGQVEARNARGEQKNGQRSKGEGQRAGEGDLWLAPGASAAKESRSEVRIAAQAGASLLDTDLKRLQEMNVLEWPTVKSEVLEHISKFLDAAEALERTSRNVPVHDRQLALLQIFKGIQTAIAIPFLSDLKLKENPLADRTTSLWFKIGDELEKPSMDEIRQVTENEFGNPVNFENLGKRMKTAQIGYNDAGALEVQDLRADVWSLYPPERIVSTYLTRQILKRLIEGLPLTLDASDQMVLPEKVGGVNVHELEGLIEKYSKQALKDPVVRFNALVKFENDFRKDPVLVLNVIKELGIVPAGTPVSHAVVSDFAEALLSVTLLLKTALNWEFKKALLLSRSAFLEDIQKQLGLSASLKLNEIALRLVSLNIPEDVIQRVADGKMNDLAEFEKTGRNIAGRGGVREVLLAAGKATRWFSSLEPLIDAGVMNADDVPTDLPRALAAFWYGNQNTDGGTGVKLAMDNLIKLAGNGSPVRLGYTLSPWTWKPFLGATYEILERNARNGNLARVPVDAIAFNTSRVWVVKEGQIVERPESVLGHGDGMGFMFAFIQGLMRGEVYSILRSADGPTAQLGQKQFDRVLGFMAKHSLAHVGIGNWRNLGQAGGGYVTVNGQPDIVDTPISKEKNKNGFLADKDITLFSTFINVINQAALLYAVSEGVEVEGRSLITWPEVQKISDMDATALAQLKQRLEKLTLEQEEQLMLSFSKLLPYEYVEKKESGQPLIQWEQISGMWHGVVEKRIRQRFEREGVERKEPLSYANADLSLREFSILSRTGGTEDVPLFAEVKSAVDILVFEKLVQAGLKILADKGVLSHEIGDAITIRSEVRETAANVTTSPTVPLWRQPSSVIKNYQRWQGQSAPVTTDSLIDTMLQNYDLGVTAPQQLEIKKLPGGTLMREPLLITSPTGQFVLKYGSDNEKKAKFVISIAVRAHEQGVRVPGILKNRKGEYLVEAGGLYYYVEQFIPGGRTIAYEDAQPRHFEQLGKVIAQLHNALSGFTPEGEKHERLAIDITTAEGDLRALKNTLEQNPGRNSRGEKLFREHADFILAEIEVLKTKLSLEQYHSLPSVAVHGDVKMGNVLWNESGSDVKALLDWERSREGQARIEDFKNVFSSAAGFSRLRVRAYDRENLKALLSGYQQEIAQKLTAEELDAIPSLLGPGAFLWDLARLFVSFGDTLNTSDDRYGIAVESIKKLQSIDNDFQGAWWKSFKQELLQTSIAKRSEVQGTQTTDYRLQTTDSSVERGTGNEKLGVNRSSLTVNRGVRRALMLFGAAAVMGLAGCEQGGSSDNDAEESQPTDSPAVTSDGNGSGSSEPAVPSAEEASFLAARSSASAMNSFILSYIAARGYAEGREGWSEGVAPWYSGPANGNRSYGEFTREFSDANLAKLVTYGQLIRVVSPSGTAAVGASVLKTGIAKRAEVRAEEKKAGADTFGNLVSLPWVLNGVLLPGKTPDFHTELLGEIRSAKTVADLEGARFSGSIEEKEQKTKIFQTAFSRISSENLLVRDMYFSQGQGPGKIKAIRFGRNINMTNNVAAKADPLWVAGGYDPAGEAMVLAESVLGAGKLASDGAVAGAGLFTRGLLYQGALQAFLSLRPTKGKGVSEELFLTEQVFVLMNVLDYMVGQNGTFETMRKDYLPLMEKNAVFHPSVRILIEKYSKDHLDPKESLKALREYVGTLYGKVQAPVVDMEALIELFGAMGDHYLSIGDYKNATHAFVKALAYDDAMDSDSTRRKELTLKLENAVNLFHKNLPADKRGTFVAQWLSAKENLDGFWRALNDVTLLSELAFVPEATVTTSSRYDQLKTTYDILSHLEAYSSRREDSRKIQEFFDGRRAMDIQPGKLHTESVRKLIDAYGVVETNDYTDKKSQPLKKILWLTAFLQHYARLFQNDEATDSWKILPQFLKVFSNLFNDEEKDLVYSLVTLQRNFSTLHFGEGSPTSLRESVDNMFKQRKSVEEQQNEGPSAQKEQGIDPVEQKESEMEKIYIDRSHPDFARKEVPEKLREALDFEGPGTLVNRLERLFDNGTMAAWFPRFGRGIPKKDVSGNRILKNVFTKYEDTSVSEHTLELVGYLEMIEKGQFDEFNKKKQGIKFTREQFELYRNAFQEIIRYGTGGDKAKEAQRRVLFYLAVLFHDIGIGKKANFHEDIGAAAIREQQIFETMGYPAEDAKEVFWLVKFHVELGTVEYGERTTYNLLTSLKEQLAGLPDAGQTRYLRTLAFLNSLDVLATQKGEPMSVDKLHFFINVLTDDNFIANFEKGFFEWRMRKFSSNRQSSYFKAVYDEVQAELKKLEDQSPKEYKNFRDFYSKAEEARTLDYAIFFLQSLEPGALVRLLFFLSQAVEQARKADEFKDIHRINFTAASGAAPLSKEAVEVMFSSKQLGSYRSISQLTKKPFADIVKEMKTLGLKIERTTSNGQQAFVFDNGRLSNRYRYFKIAALQSATYVLSRNVRVATDIHIKNFAFMQELSKSSYFVNIEKYWPVVRLVDAFMGNGKEAISVEHAWEEYSDPNLLRATEEKIKHLATTDPKKAHEVAQVLSELNDIKRQGDLDGFTHFMETVNFRNAIFNFRKLKATDPRSVVRLLYMLYLAGHDVNIINFFVAADRVEPDTKYAGVYNRILQGLADHNIKAIKQLSKNKDPFRAFSRMLGLAKDGITLNKSVVQNVLTVNYEPPRAASHRASRAELRSKQTTDYRLQTTDSSVERGTGNEKLGVNRSSLTVNRGVRRALMLFGAAAVMGLAGCEQGGSSDNDAEESQPTDSPAVTSDGNGSGSSEPAVPSAEEASFLAARSSASAMNSFILSYIAARGYAEGREGWSEGVAPWYSGPANGNRSYGEFTREFSDANLAKLVTYGQLIRVVSPSGTAAVGASVLKTGIAKRAEVRGTQTTDYRLQTPVKASSLQSPVSRLLSTAFLAGTVRAELLGDQKRNLMLGTIYPFLPSVALLGVAAVAVYFGLNWEGVPFTQEPSLISGSGLFLGLLGGEGAQYDRAEYMRASEEQEARDSRSSSDISYPLVINETRADEKQFQKALSNLQPKWWDGTFLGVPIVNNQGGADRRVVAVRALGELNDPRIVPALNIALHDTAKVVRLAAVSALRGHKSIPGIVTAFNDAEVDVRLAAIAALVDLNAQEELGKAIPEIVKALTLEDKESRAVAISALRAINALSELGKQLNNEYPDVRRAAVTALGDTKDVNAVPALVESLKDRSISDAVAAALVKIGDPRSSEALTSYKEQLAREAAERLERERQAAEASPSSSDDDKDRGYWEGIGPGNRSEVRLDRSAAGVPGTAQVDAVLAIRAELSEPYQAVQEVMKAARLKWHSMDGQHWTVERGWETVATDVSGLIKKVLPQLTTLEEILASGARVHGIFREDWGLEASYVFSSVEKLYADRIVKIAPKELKSLTTTEKVYASWVRVAGVSTGIALSEPVEALYASRIQETERLKSFTTTEEVLASLERVRKILGGSALSYPVTVLYIERIGEIAPEELKAFTIPEEVNAAWFRLKGFLPGLPKDSFFGVRSSATSPVRRLYADRFQALENLEKERSKRADGLRSRWESLSGQVIGKFLSGQALDAKLRLQLDEIRTEIASRLAELHDRLNGLDGNALGIDEMPSQDERLRKIDQESRRVADEIAMLDLLQGEITARSEVRTYETPVIPLVPGVDTTSLTAKVGTAIRVAANTVSPLLSSSTAYASEIAPLVFAGTVHYQAAPVVPPAFATRWPVFNEIISHFATASTGRMVIDQRQGVPDAASVLPLVTFALYNPKDGVVLALIAEASEVALFEKELSALNLKGVLPQNFKVQAFASENEFVGAFAEFYNAAAPVGKPVALITDRQDSVVTRKIGSRKQLLSVVGARDPLKQTASALLAADKLLNEAIWSMGYHFVSVEKLGGLEALMAELTSYIAAQVRVKASA